MVLVSQRIVVDVGQHDDSFVDVAVFEVSFGLLETGTERCAAELEIAVNQVETGLPVENLDEVGWNYSFGTILKDNQTKYVTVLEFIVEFFDGVASQLKSRHSSLFVDGFLHGT